MTDIVIAEGDYWMGIYVNGQIEKEDHRVSLLDFGKLLMQYQPINSVIYRSVDLDWFDTLDGYLPDNLNDVVFYSKD